MINLKIGGVPEHFNYPWYLALKNKFFHQQNVNLRWTDYPGGTGQMCKALREESVDIAIVLTEGIIKDIIDGNPSKILQTYVASPLVWGIHTSAQSSISTIKELENKRIAISRFGSGSHLMAIVNAHNNGWSIDELKFVVVKDLEGGINALQNNEADYFMWERFTTKPLVDKGIFKHIGNCPTPWPCFVVAVRNNILEKYPEQIKAVLDVINRINQDFKEIPNLANILSKRYEQQENDIEEWLSITEWNAGEPIGENFIDDVQNKLITFGVIEQKENSSELIKNMYI